MCIRFDQSVFLCIRTPKWNLICWLNLFECTAKKMYFDLRVHLSPVYCKASRKPTSHLRSRSALETTESQWVVGGSRSTERNSHRHRGAHVGIELSTFLCENI